MRAAALLLGLTLCAVARAATFVSDGLTVHYEVLGDDGPWVVAPLGAITGGFEPLAAAGFRVVLYDPRGRGRSDPVPDDKGIGLDADLADLGALQAALGAERVDLFGMSYFGAVAVAYAARYPDRVGHVVLSGAMAPTRAGFEDRSSMPKEPPPASDLDLDALRAEGLPDRDPRAWCEAHYLAQAPMLYEDPARFPRSSLARCAWPNEHPAKVAVWATRLFASLGDWDFRADAAALRAPLLVVQGYRDRISPPDGGKAWSKALGNPGIGPMLFVPAGHVPHVEQPVVVFTVVKEFLRGPTERRRR